MTETAGGKVPEASEATPEPASERAPATPETETPAAIWILYILGILSATVLGASFLYVLVTYIASGSSGIGLAVSLPPLIVWLGLAIAAGGTFVWRRYGRPR